MTQLFVIICDFQDNSMASLIFLVKSPNPLVRNLKFNYSNEDFEMKKLLLNLAVLMSKDLNILQVSFICCALVV